MSDQRKSMTFQRYGWSYHVVINSAEDLRHCLNLDATHWVATTAPVDSFHLDPVLLNLLDSDNDNRIKVKEFTTAITWLLDRLNDTSGIDASSTTLQLDSINREDDEGQRIYDTLVKIASGQDHSQEKKVALEEVRQLKEQLQNQPVSGLGVVLPSAPDDPEVQHFLNDIIQTVGGVSHPSGQQGVDLEKLQEFQRQAEEYMDWCQRGEIPEGSSATAIMPLGPDTPTAYEDYSKIRDKVDQYFVQCELLALDGRLKDSIWPREKADEGPLLNDISVMKGLLERSPVAEPTPERILHFDGKINPYYADQMKTLYEKVVDPLLGETNGILSEKEWSTVKGRLKDYEAWQADKQGQAVAKAGVERLREYLDDKYGGATRDLIQRASESAFVFENVCMVEKLALYQGHLLNLANNFISFPHLYDGRGRALFEEGRLVMDGRRFNLAIRVNNRSQHKQAAKGNPMFLMYVEIESKEEGKKFEVAVPVTASTKGNLGVGKHGVFKTVEGTEWTAQVVDIIDHPVGLREAMWAPFQRLGKALTGKIESITAASEKKLDKAVADAVSGVEQGVSAQPKPVGGVGMGGMVAGAGIAVAALGFSLAFVTKTLAGLPWWQILSGIGGVILAVLIPTMIIAVIRLRRRDLSCIFEGSGWGVNARMRLTRKLRHYFTQKPPFPPGSRFRRRPG